MPLIVPESPFYLAIGTAIALIWAIFLLSTPLGKRSFDRPLQALMILAALVYARHIGVSDYHFQGNDEIGHLRYVAYLYQFHTLPPTQQDWQFYQPPFYYLMALPFYALGDAMGMTAPIEMARFFSLCNYLLLIMYSVAFFRLLTTKRWLIYFAASLLAFWPSALAYTGKINNDIPIYTLSMITLYYLARWQKLRDVSDIRAAIMAAFFAIGVKTSGTLIAFILALVLFFHLKKWSDLQLGRKWLMSALILLLLASGVNFGRTWEARLHHPGQNYIIGNIDLTQRFFPRAKKRLLITDDSVANVLFINPYTFLKDTYYVPGKRSDSNLLFWHTWLKTLMMGKDAWVKKPIAIALNIACLALLIFLLPSSYHALKARTKWQVTLLPGLLLLAANCGGMIYMRLYYGLTPFAEVRYMYQIVPLLLAFFIVSLVWRQQARRWFNTGLVIGSFIVMAAVVNTAAVLFAV